MTRTSWWIVAIVAGALGVAGCTRGQPRERRNLTLIPDMEFQPKYEPQDDSPFFADGRTMRTPPVGTVARGTLREDVPLSFGRASAADTTWLVHNALPVTLELLERGRRRFNIYCAPCHDRTGSGQGMVVPFGLVPPPTFHQDRIRQAPDGYLFNVITHGVRTMPSYAAQIPAADRWAIIGYLRSLQRAQNATLADVPPDARGRLE